ncbi:MAG TPA: hypothetical protein VF999_10505 [Thermoanaerobaculia bacterium]
MEYPILVILGVLAIGIVTVVLPVALTTLADHREPKSLPCPETGLSAIVQVDAGRAARAAIFGRVRLAVHNCSRWPERAGCGQGCVAPLVEAPVPPDANAGSPSAS